MKKKPKIAIIAPYWRPAQITGTELAHEMMFRALQEKYELMVISSDSFGVRYFRNILINPRIASTHNIIRLPNNPISTLLHRLIRHTHGPIINPKELLQVLRKFDINTILLSSFPHDINQKTIAVIKKHKLPIRVYFQPHFHPEQYQKYNKTFYTICKQVDQLLVWTQDEKRRIGNKYRVPRNKITIINPPLFRTIVSPLLSKQDNDGRIKILYAGEKNEHKGIYSLINALKCVSDQKVQLITIGPHDWKWELYKYTHKLPFLQDLGYVSSKTKETVFSECDIFCLPSHADSFGFAYLDAWRYKKPVIAADTPAMREVVGKGGLFVDRRNPQAFTRTLNTLINNKKLRERLGNIGFRSLNRYSYRKNIQRFLQIFK